MLFYDNKVDKMLVLFFYFLLYYDKINKKIKKERE